MKKKKQKHPDYRWLHIIFFIVIASVLLYVRVVPYTVYFSPDMPLKDPDSCYHLRRIIYSATNSMQIPFYDPLLAHPHGSIPMLSPLYDWISALFPFFLSFGHPSPLFVQHVAMMLSPIIGLLELFFLGLLAYKATNSITIGLMTGFMIGILDLQIIYSSIQIIDHNSMVLLIFALILYKSFMIMRKEIQLILFFDIVLLALLLALLFWVWSGAYIYIGVFAFIHFLYPLIYKRYSLLYKFAYCYFLSGFLVAPLAAIHYSIGKALLRYEHVSLFTVLFFISLSAGFYAAAFVLDWKNNNKNKLYLLKLAFSLSLLIVSLLFIFKPFMEGVQFARAHNAWLSTVSESKSLFMLERGPIKVFYLDNAITKLGYLIFIFPIAFALVLLKRVPVAKEFYLMLIGMTVILGFLACSQQKFALEFSIPYGMVLALFFVWLYNALTKKTSYALIVIFALVIILSLLPMKKDLQLNYDPLQACLSTLKWLKNDANLQGTSINSGHAQNEGMIAPWDFGHHLHLYSEMPTIADNFGINIEPFEGFYDMARFFLSEDEDSAVAIMKKYKCSYVAVSFSSVFEQYAALIGMDPIIFHDYQVITINGEKRISRQKKPRFFNTIGLRLGDLYGSANPAPNEKMFDAAALKHFRLLHESPEAKLGNNTASAGVIKIYQYVEGIRLNVPVSGNPFYELEALIITNTRNSFYYRQKGYLNKGVIVPYPTNKVKDYPYAQSYKVKINGNTYEFNDVVE